MLSHKDMHEITKQVMEGLRPHVENQIRLLLQKEMIKVNSRINEIIIRNFIILSGILAFIMVLYAVL